jgi:anti-anti-sigma regulatory factor
MKVKIDTKEKMHVITIEEQKLTANMTEELQKTLLSYLEKPIKNVVVSFEHIIHIDETSAKTLLNIQQTFYEAGNSMVFCKFLTNVEKFLEENEILEIMNVTPTESEAWDIVQMEEIERELF